MESVWSKSNHDLRRIAHIVALGKEKRDEDCGFQVLNYFFVNTLENCEEVYLKPSSVLEVGQTYSKKDLATLVNEPQPFHVREGVSSCNNSNSHLLFVDLEKEEKEERFHFDDFFEEDFFHWDSQTTQHIKSPKIQAVVNDLVETYLFVRVKQKEKSKT